MKGGYQRYTYIEILLRVQVTVDKKFDIKHWTLKYLHCIVNKANKFKHIRMDLIKLLLGIC